MKIAVVGTRGIPSSYGGIEKHCEEIYTRMVGHEVTIYARKGYVDDNLTEYKNVKLKPLFAPKTTGLEAFIHTAWAVVNASFSDADIIHFHAQGPCFWAALARVLAPKKKLVFTCHGIDWQRDKWSFPARSIIKFGELSSAKLFHGKISVSDYLKNYYKEKYNVPVTTIRNGVTIKNTDKFDLIENKFDIEKGNYILSIGRLVPEKGFHHLIDAYKKINTDKKLVIAGGGAANGYEEMLQEKAAEDSRIIFTSYVFGEELRQLYGGAYLYVSSSTLEGLPLTLLEAMSQKIPVLVSDIEPHTEVINSSDYGFIMRDKDIFDIKNKIEYVLSLPREFLDKKASNALKLIQEEYSWKSAVEETERVYSELNVKN